MFLNFIYDDPLTDPTATEIYTNFLHHFFQNDTILPGQLPYVSDKEKRSAPEALKEKGLLLVSLYHGLMEATTPIVKGKDRYRYRQNLLLRKEAIEWIQTGEEILGFGWYCYHLGFNASWMRKQVLRLIAEGIEHSATLEKIATTEGSNASRIGNNESTDSGMGAEDEGDMSTM